MPEISCSQSDAELDQIFRKRMPLINNHPFESITASETVSSKTTVYKHYDLLSYVNAAVNNLHMEWSKDYTLNKFIMKRISNFELWLHANDPDIKICIKPIIMNIAYDMDHTIKKPAKVEHFSIDTMGHICVKILDLVRIFTFLNPDYKVTGGFEYQELKFIERVMKTHENDDQNDIINLFDNNTLVIEKFVGKKKQAHTVENFANKLWAISGTVGVYAQLYNCSSHSRSYKSGEYASMMAHVVTVDRQFLQQLMNLYFLNTTKSVDKKRVVTFDEPRTLVSILEEYHKDARVCHAVRKFVNRNKKGDSDEGYCYKSVHNFIESESEKLPLTKWHTIQFREWDLDRDVYDIETAFDDMLFKLKKPNEGRYNDSYYCRSTKNKKRVNMRNDIRDGVDMLDDDYYDQLDQFDQCNSQDDCDNIIDDQKTTLSDVMPSAK
jgi:hypothetical protein